MLEEWKKIEYGEGRYEISNLGRVRSIYLTKPPKILNTKVSKNNGYEMISFTFLGISKTFTIHSLVARAFIRDYDGNEEVVNHIDGNKLNNHISNLEIIDRKGNLKHAMSTELQKTNHKIVYQGVEYLSKTQMRRALHMGERVQNRLIENGEAVLLTNYTTPKNAKNHSVQYQGEVYESKNELRRAHNIGEKLLNKMIADGTVVVLQTQGVVATPYAHLNRGALLHRRTEIT